MRFNERLDLSHKSILNALQLLIERKPKQKEFAEATNSKISKICNRAVRETQYPLSEVKKICDYFNVNYDTLLDLCRQDNQIITNSEISIETTPQQENFIYTSDKDLIGKDYKIPYWKSGNEETDKRLRDDELTEFCLDMQFIVKKLKCNPENLRFISMPGDDMDGGDYPIKNKDLLLIDISRTDTYESGVYFATSHNNSRIYVRRIFEKMAKEKSYYTSVDNERYKSIIDKIWTEEAWKAADVKVIGRVIKNMSYVI